MIKHWQEESDEAVAIIRTMTAANCNHCRDEAHNQKLLESARKMSSQSGASWEGESFIFEYVIFILRKPVCKI